MLKVSVVDTVKMFMVRLVQQKIVLFAVVAAILKSNHASACKEGYQLLCTVRYLD
jgi:hypothetical protein